MRWPANSLERTHSWRAVASHFMGQADRVHALGWAISPELNWKEMVWQEHWLLRSWERSWWVRARHLHLPNRLQNLKTHASYRCLDLPPEVAVAIGVSTWSRTGSP